MLTIVPTLSMAQCLMPLCRREIGHGKGGRGLCNRCYCTAYQLVAAEKTSWEELERLGKAMPARAYRPRGAVTAWFLDGSRVNGTKEE